MSKCIARLLSLLILFTGLLVAGAIDTARAQPAVGVNAYLCVGNPTAANIAACVSGVPVATVLPYTPVFYVINMSNGGATGPVNVTDTFQPGFNFLNATCAVTVVLTPSPCPSVLTATGLLAGTTGFSTPVSLGSFTQQQNQAIQIIITGFFSLPGSGVANNSVTVTGGATPITNGVTAAVTPGNALTNDLAVSSKVVSPSAIDVSNGPQIVHYKIVIANLTGPDVYLGQLFTLVDELRIPLTSAPMKATFVSATCTPSAGSTCLAPVPTLNTSNPSGLTVGTFTWAPFLKWNYPTASSGLLLAGGTMTIEYDVSVERVLDCVKQQSGGDFLDNHAFFNLTTTTGITIADVNSLNDVLDSPPNTSSDVAVTTGAYIVDPFCGVTNPAAPPPLLAMTKKQIPSGTVAWPGIANYVIQLKNNGTTPIAGINLLDFMREDPGTPPHDIQLMTWNCIPATACAGVIPAVLPQSQQFYFSTKQIWRGTIPVLLPAQTVTLNITVKFSNPTCDSLDAIQPNTNTNMARASYNAVVIIAGNPTPVTYHLAAAVTTPMATVAKCQFNVSKVFVGPHPVTFPKVLTYDVQFRSLEIVPRQVVVYDALRVMPANLTAGMPFTANYACTPNAPGSVTGPIPGFPIAGITNGTVVNTALPSQGARIFQSTGFLTFMPGATLTCTVSVTVNRPPSTDPFCLGKAPGGQLENLGDMTVSLIPDNNVFPPSGTYNGIWPLPITQPPLGPLSSWRSLTDPLPRCFDLVVNKHSNPTTTWAPGGPGLTYTMTVTNQGNDAIVPGPNNPVLTDTFTPNQVGSSFTSVCIPALPACVFSWNPSPTAGNPSQLTVTTLATGQTINTTFTVPGPFTVPVQSNVAAATMGGPNGTQLWYPRKPATLNAIASVPVLQANNLTVKKLISALQGGALPNLAGVVFPIQVACMPYGPNSTFNLTASSPSQTISVPVGSTCNVVELPLGATGTCGRPLVSVAAPPTYAPGQSVAIPPPPASVVVDVTNGMACVATGSLNVEKRMASNGGVATPIPPGVTFPVQVACTPNGPNQTVNLTAATSSVTLSGIVAGSSCTLTELPPVGPIPANCHWGPVTYPIGQTATIPAQSTIEKFVQNALVCTPIQPSACVLDPGMLAASNAFVRRVTLAQTFTPTQSGALTQVTHRLLNPSGSVADYTLLITTTTSGLPSWTGGSTSTANVLLAMSGVTIFGSGSTNGVVPIPSGQQPHLTAGTQYALILIPGSPTSGTMYWQGNSSASSYPNGSAYQLNGTTWSVPGTGPKDHGFKLDGQCP